MSQYQELRGYSALLDCEVVRLSMVGRDNQEYWAEIRADPSGKSYRERRLNALTLIHAAIERGAAPGEVEI